jgi:hypothetical protein
MYLGYSSDLGSNLIEIRYICVPDYPEREKLPTEREEARGCSYIANLVQKPEEPTKNAKPHC